MQLVSDLLREQAARVAPSISAVEYFMLRQLLRMVVCYVCTMSNLAWLRVQRRVRQTSDAPSQDKGLDRSRRHQPEPQSACVLPKNEDACSKRFRSLPVLRRVHAVEKWIPPLQVKF